MVPQFIFLNNYGIRNLMMDPQILLFLKIGQVKKYGSGLKVTGLSRYNFQVIKGLIVWIQ